MEENEILEKINDDIWKVFWAFIMYFTLFIMLFLPETLKKLDEIIEQNNKILEIKKVEIKVEK